MGLTPEQQLKACAERVDKSSWHFEHYHMDDVWEENPNDARSKDWSSLWLTSNWLSARKNTSWSTLHKNLVHVSSLRACSEIFSILILFTAQSWLIALFGHFDFSNLMLRAVLFLDSRDLWFCNEISCFHHIHSWWAIFIASRSYLHIGCCHSQSHQRMMGVLNRFSKATELEEF